MKTSTIATFIGFLLSQATLVSAAPPQVNEEYAKCVFVDSASHTTLPYRMLSPENSKAGDKYPLVVFLHGSGERGTDNEKQLAHGASTFSNPAIANKYPSFVVFPQCKDRTWTERFSAQSFMPGAPAPKVSKQEEAIVALINSLTDEYPIDKDRIYLVGISMGGIATYDLACRYPDLFAAAVPICGAVNPDRLDDAKNVSFMIFHGEEDDEIPSICGRKAYKSLSAAGANVEYIEFAGMGHDCWSSAFNYPNLLPWLYSQSKQHDQVAYNEALTCLK